MKIIDKRVPKFKEAFEYWSGSDHYKNEHGIEHVDLAYAYGYFFEAAQFLIGKYATRLKQSRIEGKEQLKKDLLKIAHYAAMVYETLDDE